MCRTPNLLWFRITDKPLAIQQSTFAYSAFELTRWRGGRSSVGVRSHKER